MRLTAYRREVALRKTLVFISLFLGLGMQLFIGQAAGAASSAGKTGLLPLGTKAPDFHLPDVVSGKIVSRDDFSGKKVLLVIFICRHCPYVQNMKQGLAKLARDYADKDVVCGNQRQRSGGSPSRCSGKLA